MNQINPTTKGRPNQAFRTQADATLPNKVLNVSVPELVYWHIRRCASESRMSIKAFMSEFCKAAKPITPSTSGNPHFTSETGKENRATSDSR